MSRYLWTVRFLIATFLALALTLLPVSGVAMAKAMEANAMQAGSCHDMPDEMPAHPMKSDMGKSCAEHCMMQVSPPLTVGAIQQPSVANAIGMKRALLIDARAPRAADPPETPPPRV